VDRQVIVHAHVALDKAGHLPIVSCAVEALQDQDVATTGCATIALATATLLWMGQRRSNRIAQPGGVIRLGRSDAVGQTSFFHADSCRTA